MTRVRERHQDGAAALAGGAAHESVAFGAGDPLRDRAGRGGSYGAAKAALAAWNVSLSAELAPRGVTCNVISAGYIAGTNFFGGGLSEERRRALVDETHNQRPGTVDDIAATAHFLASPGARHITGQTLHVNGGAHTTR